MVGRGFALRVLVLGALAFAPERASGGESERALAEDSSAFDPLSVAAEDTWPMQDACPARTRATRTRPLQGPLVEAWTFKPPGRIQGDPLVWHQWIVVESEEAGGGRTIDVLRLSDGKPVVDRKTLAAPAGGLRPVIWNDLVLVETWGGGATVLRIVPELRMLPQVQVVADLRRPLWVQGEFVGAYRYGGVQRRRFGGEFPVWSTQSEEVVGEMAVRHGYVYVPVSLPVKGYETPKALLLVLDFKDGKLVKRVELGWFAVKEPGGCSVVVGEDELFVIHPSGILLEGNERATASRCATTAGVPGGSFPLTRLHGLACWGAADFASTVASDGTGDVLIRSPFSSPDAAGKPADGRWRWRMMASSSEHTEFVGTGGRPTIARGIALFPGGSFDVADGRVIELRRLRSAGPVIPARETLLEVENYGAQLVARRMAHPADVAGTGPRLSSEATDAKVDLPAATVVSIDGAVRQGKAVWSPKDGRLRGLGADVLAASDVGLVLDKDGHVVHGPDPFFVARAVPWAAIQKTRRDWAALVQPAISSADDETISRLAGDLGPRGGKLDDLIALDKERSRLARYGGPPIPNTPRITSVAKRRAELLAAETGALWTAFSTLPDGTPFGYRVDLVRAILEREPENANAVAWLRAQLPDGVVPQGSFPALEWLDVVEAAWKTPLALVASRDKPPMTNDERILAVAKEGWRKDLLGLRSERLLLITPVALPGRIARCLSLGDSVCRALDSMFGVEAGAAAEAESLVIYLYESKEEYLLQSPEARASRSGRASLESTLGHYSPAESLSRLFVPSTREAFESVMRTLAHELTHHWLDRRMPPPAGESRKPTHGGGRGYFLEEGFATMVEEFLFDLRARTWKSLDPRADSLDSVAHAPTLIGWASLYEADFGGFASLDRTPELRVPIQWTLGTSRRMSHANLFYAQGAATCHWLFEAEGGKRRPVLLRWIQDLHGKGVEPDSVRARVGISPEQLGALVEAWALRISGRGR